MSKWYFRHKLYCRWCNKPYESKKEPPLGGFCCPAHKQAHYRAYKKWVTRRPRARAAPAVKRVTQKRHTHEKGSK